MNTKPEIFFDVVFAAVATLFCFTSLLSQSYLDAFFGLTSLLLTINNIKKTMKEHDCKDK